MATGTLLSISTETPTDSTQAGFEALDWKRHGCVRFVKPPTREFENVAQAMERFSKAAKSVTKQIRGMFDLTHSERNKLTRLLVRRVKPPRLKVYRCNRLPRGKRAYS